MPHGYSQAKFLLNKCINLNVRGILNFTIFAALYEKLINFFTVLVFARNIFQFVLLTTIEKFLISSVVFRHGWLV